MLYACPPLPKKGRESLKEEWEEKEIEIK